MDNVAYKAHTSSLTQRVDMPAQQRNLNDKNIKPFFICCCFIFVLFLFSLLLVFFVGLQSCKNMAGKNCTPKYERFK